MKTFHLAFISIRVLSIFLFASLLPASFALLTIIWETGHPGTTSGLIAQAIFYLLIPVAVWINAKSLARKCLPNSDHAATLPASSIKADVILLALVIIGVVQLTYGIPGCIGWIVQMLVHKPMITGNIGRFLSDIVQLLIGILLIGKAGNIQKILLKIGDRQRRSY